MVLQASVGVIVYALFTSPRTRWIASWLCVMGGLPQVDCYAQAGGVPVPRLIYIVESEDDVDFQERLILVGCDLDSHEARNLFEEMRGSIDASELPADLPGQVEVRHTYAEACGNDLVGETVRVAR